MVQEYFNSRADIWDATVAEKSAEKLREMAGRLGLEQGDAVLDVGSGTGVFLPFILERIGEKGQVIALDVAEKMLQKAREKNFTRNVEFLCADIMDTSLPDALFESVVCYSSFPHFADKLKAFNEIYRVMKPGGRLAVCHTSSRAAINEVHAGLPEVRDHTIPEENEMRELLAASGFREIAIEDGEENYLVIALKPWPVA